jgi:hypothetical protein
VRRRRSALTVRGLLTEAGESFALEETARLEDVADEPSQRDRLSHG